MGQKRKYNSTCVFPSICFLRFFSVLYWVFSMFPMDPLGVKITTLALKEISLLEYAVEFSQLAVLTAFDEAVLNSLFWIRGNYYRPIDLPDTTGLCWREAIIRRSSGERLSPIQNTARPNAKPTISLLHGARAHHWQRARAHRDQRAIAKECDRAEDRHRASPSWIIRPGVRAGYNHHEGESRESEERSSAPASWLRVS